MEFHVDGNVLEFELEVPEGVDLDSVEAKAREEAEAGKDVEVRREDGEVVVIYRARDKVMEYRFSEHKVRGKVEYASDIADPRRAFESQARIIREYWLGGSGEPVAAEKPEPEESRDSPIRRAIIEVTRKLYEEKGVPPSAREIARALGYKSPRVLYGTDRFSSLKEVYEAAGIPVEPRSFPGREEADEEVEEVTEAKVKAEPIPGYRLEARIVGNYLYKVVEVEVLGQKLETEMRFPLKEAIEVCKAGYRVRVVPTAKGPVVEIWRRVKSKKRKK